MTPATRPPDVIWWNLEAQGRRISVGAPCMSAAQPSGRSRRSAKQRGWPAGPCWACWTMSAAVEGNWLRDGLAVSRSGWASMCLKADYERVKTVGGVEDDDDLFSVYACPHLPMPPATMVGCRRLFLTIWTLSDCKEVPRLHRASPCRGPVGCGRQWICVESPLPVWLRR